MKKKQLIRQLQERIQELESENERLRLELMNERNKVNVPSVWEEQKPILITNDPAWISITSGASSIESDVVPNWTIWF